MTRAPQVQVGVVAVDPLRLLGLQTILEESGLAARSASLDEALVAEDFAAVLLDGACVEDLAGVVERFHTERPKAKVVVMGDRFHARDVQAVVDAGAKGYLEESASESEIRAAMRAVLSGSVWAPRNVMARLIEAGGVPFNPEVEGRKLEEQMTHREREVLGLLVEGRTNREIAKAMGVEPVTVKAHMGRMLRKAGAKNRVELTLKALLGGFGKLAKA